MFFSHIRSQRFLKDNICNILMSAQEDQEAVEAILFASGRALEETHLQQLAKLTPRRVRTALQNLQQAYAERKTALFIWNEGTRWKLNVKEAYVPLVKNLTAETELSKPVLETLAVIAFRSPVLQTEIIKTRGDGAYAHINELVERGFITKEKFSRSYKLKIAEKFYHYFDVEGDADIREALAKAKRPDPAHYAKNIPKKIGELEVVDALDDQAFEQRRKETQLEIYEITQQRENDRKNYLKDFEQRLQETKHRINEAEQAILEQKQQAPPEQQSATQEGPEGSNTSSNITEGEEKTSSEPDLDKDPLAIVKEVEQKVRRLTGEEDEPSS